VTASSASPAGFVLAGGGSRRMGHDKASMRIDGTPMAQRVAAAMRAAGIEPVVLLGGAEREPAAGPGLRRVADRHPGEGPLGAIAHALTLCPGEVAIVAACDLLDPDRATFAALAELASDDTVDAVVPMHAGRAQWTVAAWRRSAAPTLQAAFATGERAVHRAAADLRIRWMTGGAAGAYRDADTPDDVRRWIASRSMADMSEDPEVPALPEVDVDELERHLTGGAALFDVREPDEYETAHIAGAQLVPLATVPDHTDLFAGRGTVFVVCAKGGRSAKAVEFLREQGIDAVNVAGGTGGWIAAGKPTLSGDQTG